MQHTIAALFDLDGVIIDTEAQYDVFWKKTSEDCRLGIENFEKIIKGTTLPTIMSRYFSHLPEDQQQKLIAEVNAFDIQLKMIPIAGALDFLSELKKAGIPMGLVTSSSDQKLAAVFQKLPIRDFFDTVVSADRITRGKPDPMCYLLAAKDLGMAPDHCFVLEDSFSGIQSGKSAGMKVIGLATTNPASAIQADCVQVIPDFQEFHLKDFLLYMS
ncbi:MAG: HAD family phosphatase [Dysgonamonadaceae bacterium]|jgi:HAD superfamily hydrolase (TIGR01509 family)|nr:HAD family phosphatase [Dysgonamonadaceae bacterium]